MNLEEYEFRKTWKCEHRHNGLEHAACYFRANPRQPRVGYLDIESSGLKADFGIVYSWFIKEGGKESYDSYILNESDYQNGVLRDKECIRQLVEAIQKYDVIVTYYGGDYQFDVPFLRTRALKHGFQFPVYGQIIHLDLYQKVKGKLKLGSNSLDSVANFLKVKHKKTKIDSDYWNRASMGYDEEALKYIQEHNKLDVIILEEVHEAIKPYFVMTRRSL